MFVTAKQTAETGMNGKIFLVRRMLLAGEEMRNSLQPCSVAVHLFDDQLGLNYTEVLCQSGVVCPQFLAEISAH